MTAQRRQRPDDKSTKNANGGTDTKKTNKAAQRKKLDEFVAAAKLDSMKGTHLAPLGLVMVVLVCSGILWVAAFRDVMATGRSVYGSMDDSMLEFTKSTQFFENSMGWKSKQGGLSTIEPITTDKNNMGGLFVRKVGGAAALAVHTQKIAPLVFQPSEAHFGLGHFDPMLITCIFGNMAIASFYLVHVDTLKAAGAGQFSFLVICVLVIESIVMFAYYIMPRKKGTPPPPPSTNGSTHNAKGPKSITNRIVMRTVAIVSGIVALLAARDLLLPGTILDFIPRDDIFLEWTGALLHSPPPGSEEEAEHGMEAPLYIGDKFVSQLMGLHLLITCIQKFATAFFIRTGTNGSGEIKCKIFWRVQSIGDGLVVFLIRLFAPAAKSASLDLRWHLMTLAYETFILGLYAYA